MISVDRPLDLRCSAAGSALHQTEHSEDATISGVLCLSATNGEEIKSVLTRDRGVMFVDR